MDIERAFISSVVRSADLSIAIEAKISTDFFEDRDSARVWKWLLAHHTDYGVCATAAALERAYPAYELVNVDEPEAYLLDELRSRRKHNLLQVGLLEAAQALDDEEADAPVATAVAKLTSTLNVINTELSVLRDTNIIDTWELRMDKYRKYKEAGGTLRGISTGLPGLDSLCSGYQPEQLVTYVGSPKAGKTSLLLISAIAAHRIGKVPLFIGFEMGNDEQEARHDSMAAHVDHRKLLNGTLNKVEMARLEKELRKRQNMQPFIFSSDIESGTTVSGVAAKIAQYRPSICFVDGVYLMDNEEDSRTEKGSPQALTAITRGLKRLAQRYKIPIVITTQVLLSKTGKHGGSSMYSIGYSGSFGQDSDVVVSVDRVFNEDGTPNDEERLIKVLASRSGPNGQVRVKWDWATGEFEEIPDTYTEGEDTDEENYSFSDFTGAVRSA